MIEPGIAPTPDIIPAARIAPTSGRFHNADPVGPGQSFIPRHIGADTDAVASMLAGLGLESLEALADAVVPATIRSLGSLDLPEPTTEAGVLAELRSLATLNRPMVSMIGLGYSDTLTPAVIRRGVLENPAWYTAYTPYQPEISQGRLEALLAFQTMVADLTGLPISNASLLDEPTAAAEAMTLARRAGRAASPRFLVDADTHPQTLAVLATRAEPLGIELALVDVGDARGFADVLADGCFGVLLSLPGSSGAVPARDVLEARIAAVHAEGALVAMTTDLLALTVITPPGELGADIAVGSAQRFGVPMGFGGPHAGFMAVRRGLERSMPGRLVGVSVDADGRPAHRLALQTREQHIRREKATSNICTAQVLLAVTSAMYAVHHGPDGLRAIGERAHGHAVSLAQGLQDAGLPVVESSFFDTVRVHVPGAAAKVVAAAAESGINLRLVDADAVSVSTDETTTQAHIAAVLAAFDAGTVPAGSSSGSQTFGLHPSMVRTSPYLTHPTFHEHRSETALMRYLRRLSDADIALDRAMIPLGSCTMKLNAAAEMESITWPAFAGVHPFAPATQAAGTLTIIDDLQRWLCEITGYDAVSLQPNAGSQGEFAGLLAIRAYHRAHGEPHRDICLIPSSAHGTNAASAVMAGLRVVVVACDESGNIDVADLQAKLVAHEGRVAGIMITYPSTHGVYESTVTDICAMVHDAGGQVYVDGANLNALVGLAKPGRFGADVSHLNLHKTFCIPHGGGGPGVGPVAVRAHLAAYLPSHPLQPLAGPPTGEAVVGPVSGAPWGSAGILGIPWAYIRLMGAMGLVRATSVAVLSANHIASRLAPHFPILYTGARDLVAHECILDLRPLTRATGVTVDDVAKRLIDHGFHAPTVSFPVAGTLMIEPTESEDLHEIDRFCDALIAIRREIDAVAEGVWPIEDSPLRQAPHTAAALVGPWERPYSREVGAFPGGVEALVGIGGTAAAGKYWPPVSRIDGAHGDRNLVCACPAPEAFED